MRLIIALGVGLVLILLLASASPQAGVAGLSVFTVSALVAYAANAKQVSKVPEPLPPRRPSLAAEADARALVMLAASAEPATYEGPAYWAKVYGQRQTRGQRVAHWFARPLAYSRIRAAYAALGGVHPLAIALREACARLQETLGPDYVVRHAYLRSHPHFVRALLAAPEEGFRHVIIVPLGVAAVDTALRQTVADSRIRELGLKVTYIPTPTEPPGASALYADHLTTLEHGRPLNIAPDVTAEQIRALARLVVHGDESAPPREDARKG